jgi:mRNA interferase RelE/StbE
MYRVEVAPGAERDIRKLAQRASRDDFERLRHAIGALAQDARPAGARKLRGAERAYRIRVGDYRIVYNIYDDRELILLLYVGRRDESTYPG